MSKMTHDQVAYQALVRRRGTNGEWTPVMHGGQRYYADTQGVAQLQQMTGMMAAHFPHNEYTIDKVNLV